MVARPRLAPRPQVGQAPRMRAYLLAVAVLLAGCGGARRPNGGVGLLPAGPAAPALTAVDQRGRPVSLAAARGRVVVVYFYPRDDTPGCTKEACAFRDAWRRLDEGGITVIGVSSDDARSHAAFAEKHALPFSLVADTDHAWARAFGVSSTLGMYERVTFVLDRAGHVARVYPDVDPALHAEQILGDARAIGP